MRSRVARRPWVGAPRRVGPPVRAPSMHAPLFSCRLPVQPQPLPFTALKPTGLCKLMASATVMGMEAGPERATGRGRGHFEKSGARTCAPFFFLTAPGCHPSSRAALSPTTLSTSHHVKLRGLVRGGRGRDEGSQGDELHHFGEGVDEKRGRRRRAEGKMKWC